MLNALLQHYPEIAAGIFKVRSGSDYVEKACVCVKARLDPAIWQGDDLPDLPPSVATMVFAA